MQWMMLTLLPLFYTCSYVGAAQKTEITSLVHPGIMVSKDMLDNLRSNVQGKKEPTFSAYSFMVNETLGRVGPNKIFLANLSYEASPIPCSAMNMSQSPGTRWLSNKEDSLAAYTVPRIIMVYNPKPATCDQVRNHNGCLRACNDSNMRFGRQLGGCVVWDSMGTGS
eukprot:m.180922 g.180922  ORF g.180922 m.180922 type:complete len:167 (-) comp15508_c0_seq3:923-1423(-)